MPSARAAGNSNGPSRTIAGIPSSRSDPEWRREQAQPHRKHGHHRVLNVMDAKRPRGREQQRAKQNDRGYPLQQIGSRMAARTGPAPSKARPPSRIERHGCQAPARPGTATGQAERSRVSPPADRIPNGGANRPSPIESTATIAY